MSQYIYNIFVRNTDCTECMGNRVLVLATGKKWVATRFLSGILESGLSIQDYEVARSREGLSDTSTMVDAYEFMQIDLGETL